MECRWDVGGDVYDVGGYVWDVGGMSVGMCMTSVGMYQRQEKRSPNTSNKFSMRER